MYVRTGTCPGNAGKGYKRKEQLGTIQSKSMRLLICIVFLSVAQVIHAQYRIIGFVYDAAEDPFIGTEVRLTGGEGKMVTHTDLEGRFEFHDVVRGEYAILVITDYGLIEKKITVRTSLELHLQRSRNVKMDEVVVRAVRSDDTAPIVKMHLDEDAIRERNLGQDVPFLLKWTPSTTTTSDAGTGIGYTGIRIRGTDPTRTNVTINGVPLNDAESQNVFWVDLPDVMGSTESAQIVRGVGESTFGTGAFGATINLNTNNTHIEPYGRIGGTVGSFGTYKGSVGFGTGLLGNHWTIDGRASIIQSDGYIDRASADLKSYFASAAYIGSKTSVRFTTFGGSEVTYQAWNGVPAQYINDPELRTFNTAGMEKPGDPYDNEVDDYTQTHYQLHVNQSIFTQLQGFLTLHYTHGNGFFEQYKNAEYFDSAFSDFLAQYNLENDDVIRRRWLDNDFYGIIGGLHFTDPADKYTFRISGGYNKYAGDHFGEIIWSATDADVADLPYYYFNDATKTASNIFAKLNYNISDRLRYMIDLQYRAVQYDIDGLDSDGAILSESVKHQFFNPKVGIGYQWTEHLTVNYYFGIANREPNREDYIAALEPDRPLHERLYDNELILTYNLENLKFEAVGYFMKYKDQLAVTGQINDVGAPTRVNVDDSYRLGIEINGHYAPTTRWDISLGATLSQNRIKEFDEHIADFDTGIPIVVTHTDVDLAFSPSTLITGSIGYQILQLDKHAAMIALMTKLVGQQYVDNTGNPASRIDSYSFSDLQLQYAFKWKSEKILKVNVLVRNIFDSKYHTNAWNYRFKSGADYTADNPYVELESGDVYHERGYFPQSGRNLLVGLSLLF
ncbi:MAG: TonB-dependent receptor [Bacteroidetes bacterium]|nr:MAG: TonB-dependent receptor [Bacteroidota bacterium]